MLDEIFTGWLLNRQTANKVLCTWVAGALVLIGNIYFVNNADIATQITGEEKYLYDANIWLQTGLIQIHRLAQSLQASCCCAIYQ